MTDMDSAVALAREYAAEYTKLSEMEERLTQAVRLLVKNRNLSEQERDWNGRAFGQVLGDRLFRRLLGPDYAVPIWWFLK